MKISNNGEVEKVKKPEPPKDEATRRAEVRRRWRILGMKIKFGLGAQAMAVKRRNLKDAESFIDKESEEACKEDQMDLEGKCMRKKMDKRHFRKGGIMVGSTQTTATDSSHLPTFYIPVSVSIANEKSKCLFNE